MMPSWQVFEALISSVNVLYKLENYDDCRISTPSAETICAHQHILLYASLLGSVFVHRIYFVTNAHEILFVTNAHKIFIEMNIFTH